VSLTNEDIAAIGAIVKKFLDERFPDRTGNDVQILPAQPLSDPIGPLNADGAHQLLGYAGWFFTKDGYRRAKTPQQIANNRVQLGLDQNGNEVPAGPPPVGWEKGQTVNTFMVPLERDGGSDGIGGIKWVKADGHKSGRPKDSPWEYPRVRVRVEGIDKIRAELDKNLPKQN
jgi:hypothetical protein